MRNVLSKEKELQRAVAHVEQGKNSSGDTKGFG
jgi:hypothetical protein